MKKYRIYDYNDCPLAKAVENAVNTCSSVEKQHLEVGKILGYQERQTSFFIACIFNWAQAEHYDERNKATVLISRKIAEHFPQLKNLPFSPEICMEAFGFTIYAHRYLQSNLFKVILHDLQKTGEHGIYQWYDEQQFVIDDIMHEAIPYEEYKKKYYTR